MNVVVDPKPNCIAMLHVELPPEKVAAEWQNVAREFQRLAKVSGYRPGKAPQALVDKKFAPQIQEEVTNKLLREAMNDAIREKHLRVLTVSKVDKVEIGADKTMRFTATLVMSPEFDIPDYSGIELEAEKQPVSDSEIDAAVDRLAEQHAEFELVEGRPLQMEDFAVVSYAASVDGRPLLEAHPKAPQLVAGRPHWWIRMAPETLMPGFCAALEGIQAGESRAFAVDVPEGFPIPEMRGRQLQYDVTLHEIRSRLLPARDEALAAKIEEGATMAEIREGIRERLERVADAEFEAQKRSAAIRHLLANVRCEVPAHLVRSEMSSILREIVHENQVRGISDDEIKAHQNEIVGAAHQSAAERVRSQFILLRIAEKENIEVTEQDLAIHVANLAGRYRIPIHKLVNDLKRKDAIGTLRDQILAGKALDFVVANGTVRKPLNAPPNPAEA